VLRITRDYFLVTVMGILGVLLWLADSSAGRTFSLDGSKLLGSVFILASVGLLLRRVRRMQRNFTRKTQRFNEERHRLQSQQQTLLKLATSNLRHSGAFLLALQETLEAAANTLQIERAAFWKLEGSNKLSCINLYEKSLHHHHSGNCILAHERPGLFRSIKDKRVIVVHELANSEYADEASDLVQLGITSIIIAPVRLRGDLCGLLCLAHFGPSRHWTIDEQHFAGSLGDMIALCLEAHERGLIQQALETKETELEQMALFASLCPAPILRFNHEGLVIAANPAATELMQIDLSNPEVDHPHIAELIPGVEDLDIATCITKAAEVRTVGKIGERSYHFLIRGIPELSSGHMYGIDITDLKRTQQRLIESKKFLRQVIDLSPNLIHVKDAEGRFTLANQATAAFYGTNVHDILYKVDQDFLPNTDEMTRMTALSAEVLLQNREMSCQEETLTDATKTSHTLHTVRRPLRIHGDGELQVLTVATDISELKRLQEELLHSQKMDAVGQLAGGIAHDFNNLLTGILGCTGLLKLHSDLHPEVAQATDTIETAAQRAGQLTQKMLGFARRGKHQNVPVDLHATIDETLLILHRTIENNIVINRQFEADSAHVLGDPTQLQQIVLNLAINARDAMSLDVMGSDGGELSIATRILTAEDAGLRDPEHEYGRFVELAVTDTGCGMNQAVKAKAFDPFFTTKPPGKGTGMGLSMVYGIVKNHDGFIKIESAEGSGTTVSILFPLLDVRSVRTVKALPPRPISGRGRILVVDDHAIVRSITCKMLSSLGYSVATASDGIEAIEYVKAHQKQIDLIILDMVMPRMGARECFRELKRIAPDMRVMLSTGYVNNNAVQEILDQGMLGFLQKPYELTTLSEIVAKLLCENYNPKTVHPNLLAKSPIRTTQQRQLQ
jgi:PAS domain S-box-containing protein